MLKEGSKVHIKKFALKNYNLREIFLYSSTVKIKTQLHVLRLGFMPKSGLEIEDFPSALGKDVFCQTWVKITPTCSYFSTCLSTEFHVSLCIYMLPVLRTISRAGFHLAKIRVSSKQYSDSKSKWNKIHKLGAVLLGLIKT